MVSSSKILTVSYGTFSCTLEGFDESFDTMKAIAEYFRDLAQDDRYFGAEPPTPDAEMLARIAEREIERRVEARMENGSYVLRPSLGAPVAEAVSPDATPDVTVTQAAAPEADTPDTSDEDAMAQALAAQRAMAEQEAAEKAQAEADALVKAKAEEEAQARADEEQADADAKRKAEEEAEAEKRKAEAEAAETREAEAEAVAADEAWEDHDDEANMPVIDPAAAAPVADDPGSVAAKLRRIRDVVSASGTPQTAYSEDQHADAVLSDGPDEEFDVSAIGAAMALDAETPIDTQAAQAEYDEAVDEEEEGDLGDNLFTDSIAGFVAAQDSIDTPDAPETSKDVAAPEEPEAPAVRARVIKVKRADFQAAIAAGQIEEVVDEEDVSALTAEEEADLARELAEVEAELDQSWDAGDTADLDEDYADEDEDDALVAMADDQDDAEEDFEDVVAPRRDTGLRLRKDPEPTPASSWDDDEYEDDAAVATPDQPVADTRAEDWDEDLDEEIEAAFDEDDDEDDAEDDKAILERDAVDEAIERMAVSGARKAVKMTSPARVMLTENKIEEDDNSVSRILDETNTQLEEPEGNRRRSAIAHLRAAVAATRADRILGRKKDAEKETEPYRADLASAVRPRRPQATSDIRSERPAETRPAPLKLVAEQRVDTTDSVAAPSAPVRPRRVTRSAEAEMVDRDMVEDVDGGFAEFAESMGANDLPELLEAAAAYMSFVEGRDQFSRPQLMTKVRQVEMEESSREDRLRSFGQLLREGKIEKTRGGRFTASERISFKPGARAAG